MSQTRIESEFKFTAPADLPIERIDDLLTGLGIRCRLADSSTHQDVYLDDDRRTLSRHGVGLRLRRSRRGSLLCCKNEGERKGAMFVRDELELPWNGEAPGTADELPEPLRDLVEPFVLRRRLAPLVTLEVQRDHRELADGEHDLGELLYDRVAARADGREATFAEIELEVRDDLPACEMLADRLQRTFGLQVATADKPRHAAHLLGIAPGSPAPLAVDRPGDRTFRALVVAHAEAHLAAIRHAWAGVRSDRGAESVHRLRVSLRRLRTLARAAEDVWVPAEAALVLHTLRDSGRALGPLRESDVMLLHLPAWLHGVPGPLLQVRDKLLQRLQQARDEARQQAMTVLRSAAHLDSWTVLESRFTAAAMTGPAAELAAETAAAEQLERAARQARRLAQKTTAHDDLPDLHELRLALKRLRYLAEEFGAGNGKQIEVLARAQDRLGAVCDHDATGRRLLALLAPGPAASGSLEADHATLCALVGALAALEAAAEKKARKRLAAALERLDRKSLWKSFAAAPAW